MADRNERHFLEFYTPARLRQTRIVRTEGQPQDSCSDEKENPSSHPRGNEGGILVQSQRRRLFTRSASKPKFAHDGYGNSGTDRDNCENASRDLASFHFATASLKTTPPCTARVFQSSQEVHTWSSADDGIVIKTSPSYTSPSSDTSNTVLKEYRSKQSLLSSSKTRVLSFASPIPGGLRLRSPPFWKIGKAHNRKESGEQSKPQHDLNSTLPTMYTEDTNALSLQTTPSENVSPAAPSTTPKRHILWSPPGTSRLLRKYRQRTHERELDQSESSVHSPAAGASLKSPKTTGKIGLRLLDSGAKRCRNHRLALRPRTNRNDEAKVGTKEYPSNDNRSLLSPSTVSRLQQDIESYRHAHEKSKQTTSVMARPDVEETVAFDDNRGSNDSHDLDGCDDQKGSNAQATSDVLPSSSNNVVADPFKLATDAGTIDELPLEENQRADPQEDSAVWEAHAAEDTAKKESCADTIVPSVESSSITDEESGVFQSTRSKTRARRKSLADAIKAVSAAEKAITSGTQNNPMLLASELPLPSLPAEASCQNDHETTASDTPSSKGSLQSIWDALNCGGRAESGDYPISSPESRDANPHTASRCSDCVNPMASTLMKMWREEERKEADAFTEDDATNEMYSKASRKEVESPSNSWTSPPRKAFSSDLALVYGLERVENLTLARPMARPATPSRPPRPFAQHQSNE